TVCNPAPPCPPAGGATKPPSRPSGRPVTGRPSPEGPAAMLSHATGPPGAASTGRPPGRSTDSPAIPLAHRARLLHLRRLARPLGGRPPARRPATAPVAWPHALRLRLRHRRRRHGGGRRGPG